MKIFAGILDTAQNKFRLLNERFNVCYRGIPGGGTLQAINSAIISDVEKGGWQDEDVLAVKSQAQKNSQPAK